MSRLTAAVLSSFALLAGVACNHVPEPEGGTRTIATADPEPADLVKEDLKVGDGREAKTGDKVKVNYTGRLKGTGVVFDTSVGPGKKPFDFEIGAGNVIKGWDQGVPGMKVGGKRKLTIPSRLAYGAAGHPPTIPANATLVFDIELVSIDGDKAAGGSADAAEKGHKNAKKAKHAK